MPVGWMMIEKSWFVVMVLELSHVGLLCLDGVAFAA